jgi:type I restriction enzyme M protein
MSEIARRLGVTLSAVSNWRRRHPSFPPAEYVDGQELFKISEIANWLDGRKISKKDLKPWELPGATFGARFSSAMGAEPASDDAIGVGLWKELIRFRGTEDVAVYADLVLGLLYLAISDERRWNEIEPAEPRQRMVLVEQAAMEHVPVLDDLHRALRVFLDDAADEARLTAIFGLIDRARQSGLGVEIFDVLLNRFAAIEGRRDASVYTPSTVVRLLVEMVDPAPGTSVFDPCCGYGGFLVAVAQHIAAGGRRALDASFTGHVLSRRAASMAQMNLKLHGVPAELEQRADTIFRAEGLFASGRFSIVLSNPPFDMREPPWSSVRQLHGRYGPLPKNRTNFAWLQYIVSSLAANGRAAVVMPGGTLFRGGAEQKVRARMIDDGIVEAIIALPAQLFSSTGIPVTVWLLTHPKEQRRGELLLIDASDLGHMISRTQRILSREDRSRIVGTIASWRAGDAYRDVPGFAASVAVQRIREQDYVLIPARYVGTRATLDTQLKSVRQLRDDLDQLDRRAAQVDEEADRQLDWIQTWIR